MAFNPLSLITGGITGTINAVSGFVGRFTGDRTAREAGDMANDMATQGEFAAEFQFRSNRTWWDSLWDGINRAPRPLFALAILWVVFAWPYVDMQSFVDWTNAIAVVPAGFWAIAAAVITFYFGGRMLVTGQNFTMTDQQRKQAAELVKRQAEARKAAAYTNDLKDESKPLSDAAMAKWNADHGNG